MNALSKKNILITSSVLSVLGLILGRMSDAGSCGQSDVCLLIAYLLLSFVPIFIFSIIVYFLKDVAFISWRKMTGWWIIVTVILVAISPTEHADLVGFEKKTTLFLLTCFYILVSLLLIIYKSFQSQTKK